MKILVIEPSFLGDVILTLPLIHTLKKSISYAEIDIITIKEAASLLSNDPHINEIIVYDKRGQDKGILKFMALLREIRDRHYNTAILPNYASFKSNLLAYLAKIKNRIGFDISIYSFMYTKKVHYNPILHQVGRKLELVKVISGDCNIKEFVKKIKIYLLEEDIEFARNFIRKYQTRTTLIGINPTSYWGTKIWPLDYVTELADKIIQELNADVVFFSHYKYKELITYIKNKMKNIPIDTTGVFNTSQLAAAISLCDAFITTDSGSMHIAAGVDTRILAIFGPTTKKFGFYPYTEKAIVLEKDLPCKPCSSHGPRTCPKRHHMCMRSILPQEVFDNLVNFLLK